MKNQGLMSLGEIQTRYTEIMRIPISLLAENLLIAGKNDNSVLSYDLDTRQPIIRQ
jgi:hypothetical protein